MANLELLNQTFPVSENPGIDTLDPKFQEIVALVENNDFAAVAPKAEALFQDNVFDIRIIAYFLQAVFQEQELAGLAKVFACINKTLRDNWAAVGPATKKEKHTQRSLRWLIDKLYQGLQYHQVQNDASWQKWLQQVPAEEVDNIRNQIKEFQQTAGAIANDEGSVEVLNKFNEWLNDFYKLVKVEAPKEPEPEPEPAAQQQGQTDQQQNATTAPGMPTVSGSYQLTLLIKKLETFQALAQRGDFLKASVVADDINTIMASFDPRQYFPQLFAPFLGTMAVSLSQLEPFLLAKETPSWAALAQLYRTDIDTFMNLVMPS